jgi:endonuclease III
MDKTLITASGKTIPLSEYNLLQEIYIDKPWRIMVCCMLLNCTARVQVDGIRDELFSRWPDARAMADADQQELAELIRPLGFYNKRSKTLIRFSEEWTNRKWFNVKDLHGIGQYAKDSWDIFVEGKVPDSVTDHVLTRYLQWRKTN